MSERKPRLYAATLKEAAHAFAALNDWTSQPPPGRASFGGWIHEGKGEFRIAQGWANLGALLVDLGQVIRDGDGYRVFMGWRESTRQHMNRSRHYEDGQHAFAVAKDRSKAYLGADGEWHYNDRAARIAAVALAYRRMHGSFPSMDDLRTSGRI